MRKFFLALGLLFAAVPAFADVGPYQVTAMLVDANSCVAIQLNAASTWYELEAAATNHGDLGAVIQSAAFTGQTITITTSGTTSGCVTNVSRIDHAYLGTVH